MDASIHPLRGPRHAPRGDFGLEPFCRIIVHNDQIAPMDFVAHILLTVFLLPSASAYTIMYCAHLTGQAYVQSLPRPEARRRINTAQFAARMKGLPLRFTLETE